MDKVQLSFGEEQFEQASRGVINEHEQRADGGAIFKPGIGRAVNLHEFTHTRAPLA